jgi:hypothetical protein
MCMLVFTTHSISQYIIIQLYGQLCFADILLKGVPATKFAEIVYSMPCFFFRTIYSQYERNPVLNESVRLSEGSFR